MQGSVSKREPRRGARKPHNAKRAPEVESFEDLVANVGAELRRIPSGSGSIEMTRLERTFRLLVERAIEGKARDLAQVLRLMLEHPAVAKSYREEVSIFLAPWAANL